MREDGASARIVINDVDSQCRCEHSCARRVSCFGKIGYPGIASSQQCAVIPESRGERGKEAPECFIFAWPPPVSCNSPPEVKLFHCASSLPCHLATVTT